MYKNVIVVPHINVIGGVETFAYELAKKYGKDYDITVMYMDGDRSQISRLKKYARVVKWHGQEINCEKMFVAYGSNDLIEKTHAKELWWMLHADYHAYGISPILDPRITGFIAVSNFVAETNGKHFGINAEVCYNPVSTEKPRRALHLLSATRLTKEKGKHRMTALANALDAACVPFTWEVFTNDVGGLPNENVIYRKPRLDIAPFICAADYVVQLSDHEGYSYTINESLCFGVPVIVTDLPSMRELGVVDGKTGFLLPLDMSEIPTERIAKGLRRFKYEPRLDRWPDFLAPGKGTYEEERSTPVRVRCIKYYFDIALNAYQRPGDEQEVTQERADKLADLGVVVEV